MSKDYGSWSLTSLKAELEKRNAKRTGKKAVLVHRLQEYDILSGDVMNNPDTSYKIHAPDARLFHDINTDISLPVLDINDLDTFCSIAGHEDKEHAANMYKEHHLLTFRVAAEGLHHFINSKCASEMRTNIVYDIVIKYKANTILEAQCECAAGVGPYAQCKHVLTALFGLVDFIQNKNVNVRTSCASTLRTFRHPTKFYKGGPVKAEDLKLKYKGDNYKKIVNFDPRPGGSGGEKYVNFFKNHCINFAALQKGSVMPILQITTAADKRALYADHDYLEQRLEDTFLEEMLLSLLKPDEETKLERNEERAKITKNEK
ncbi:uncharacterized protein [Maniola hyperantus]|uniref:uncharacterized protein n=1 Tax=Aphantopus hyperantus TaxID=2795564 RepID=UPI003748A740